MKKNKPFVVSPETFAVWMSDLENHDVEKQHVEMDRAMAHVLEQLGYGEGVEVFRKALKFYA